MEEQAILDTGAWMALADVSEDIRQMEMLKTYQDVAGMSEEKRCEILVKLVEGEYKLHDFKLRAFTKSRLLTWLNMEKEKAQIIASSYDQVIKKMPATIAMRRVAMAQTVARDFSSEQVERLYELDPSAFREVPRRTIPSPLITFPTEQRKVRKSWWQFWKAG